MSSTAPTVFVVDDDPGIQKSLALLFKTAGFQTKTYGSADAFLEDYDPTLPGCLIVDISMKGMTGLELQAELSRRTIRIPHIFISGCAEVPTVVEAMKRGAVDFLEKPFEDERLLQNVREAMNQDAQFREQAIEQAQIKTRMEDLSPREVQVMSQLAIGKSTKKIAVTLGISPKTVAIHRTRILKKMNVDSVVELSQLLHRLDK